MTVAKRVNVRIWLIVLTAINLSFTLQDFGHTSHYTTLAWVFAMARLIPNVMAAGMLAKSYQMDLQSGNCGIMGEARCVLLVLIINHVLLVWPSHGMGFYYLLNPGNYYDQLAPSHLQAHIAININLKVMFIMVNMVMQFICLKSTIAIVGVIVFTMVTFLPQVILVLFRESSDWQLFTHPAFLILLLTMLVFYPLTVVVTAKIHNKLISVQVELALRRQKETDKFKRICNTIKEAVFVLEGDALREDGQQDALADAHELGGIEVKYANKIGSKWLRQELAKSNIVPAKRVVLQMDGDHQDDPDMHLAEAQVHSSGLASSLKTQQNFGYL